MTSAEAAYTEALRRIRAAKVTGQHWLDLGDIWGLERIPTAITELPALQELSIGREAFDPKTGEWTWNPGRILFLRALIDLSPLKSLRSLRLLTLSGAEVLDLTPLSDLHALQVLNINATPVSDLSPLSGLKELNELDISFTKVKSLEALIGLSKLKALNAFSISLTDLSPLKNIKSLRVLNAHNTLVSNLEPLRSLSGLQFLDISSSGVTNLEPINSLKSIKSLYLSHTRVDDISPIEGFSNLRLLWIDNMEMLRLKPEFIKMLPSVCELVVDRMDGVPPEVLSAGEGEDCINTFRAWLKDVKCGEIKDQEIKVFMLGNGTAGKTQICRQLRGEVFDETVPSTHGVQIGLLDLIPDKGRGSIKARLWDFGGQDIYHGTHALFLEGRAVFILVWTPNLDGKGHYVENGLPMHHHSLVYWLDYVRSMAGEDAALVVVQSKCDQEVDRVFAPLPTVHSFKRPLPQVTCSAKRQEIEELKAAISSAARYLLEVHGRYRLPTRWVAVRDHLRELRTTKKTLSLLRFNELCLESHGPCNPAVVLNYLHRCGEVFYREGLFRDEIVLDQEWAVSAIYAVLDRNGPSQTLHALGGVFTLPLLESIAWHDQFTPDEQQTILDMMESCAICFPLDERLYQNDKDRIRRFALPDFLPLEKDVTARMDALWRPDLPSQHVTLEYAFLHEGILRQFLCRIGTLGGADAAYWRYGCCFYDAATHSRARIRAEYMSTPETPAKGRIIVETCDGQAAELLAHLLKEVQTIRIGMPPQVVLDEAGLAAIAAEHEVTKSLKVSLKIKSAPTTKPLVYLSYAWGGPKEEMVDRLEQRLIDQGYEVKRDKRSMRPGDWISDFMREIGQAERVCVVLSEKYVQSAYCMRELLYLYQTSCGEKSDFLNRIVPLVLEDTSLSKTTDRLGHVRYWNQQLQELKDATTGIEPSMWGGTCADMAMIQEFCHFIELMLRHVSDHLMPRGIKEIEKDNFAAVLEALKAKT